MQVDWLEKPAVTVCALKLAIPPDKDISTSDSYRAVAFCEEAAVLSPKKHQEQY